jgi:hypothetical protein
MGGYIAKRILKRVGVCRACREDLVAKSRNSGSLIAYRAYTATSLLSPKTRFFHFVNKSIDISHKYVPTLATAENVIAKLKLILIKFLGTSVKFSCSKHDIFRIFINIFTPFYIDTWVNNINKILNGSDLRNINDNIKKLAFDRYEKYRKQKNAERKVKHLT